MFQVIKVEWQHNLRTTRHELFAGAEQHILAYVYLHNGRWRAVIAGEPAFDAQGNKQWRRSEREMKDEVEFKLGVSTIL